MVQINLFPGQEYRHRRRDRHVDTGGEGESGTNWEIRVDICTLPCVK